MPSAEKQKSHRTSSSKITAPSPMERNGTASTRSAMGKRFDPGYTTATRVSFRSFMEIVMDLVIRGVSVRLHSTPMRAGRPHHKEHDRRLTWIVVVRPSQLPGVGVGVKPACPCGCLHLQQCLNAKGGAHQIPSSPFRRRDETGRWSRAANSVFRSLYNCSLHLLINDR